MAERDASPPVLRFAMRVIDAADHDALARACCEDMVGSFGAWRARVLDATRVWHEIGPWDDERAALSISLRLSAAEAAPVRLELTLDATEDAAIVRQQLLDLVGVVRRAWSRLAQLERERSDARRDALTGLANRRVIDEWLDAAYLDALHAENSLAVMLVDLDHFKRVNDTHGHGAGDDVLQHAATCFRAHLRPGDRVCRWGGDEFLIALPRATAAGATVVADRLRRAFAMQVRARGCTMSIGIADTESLPPGAGSAASLIELADGCLLGAKAAGRDCTVSTTRLRDVG